MFLFEPPWHASPASRLRLATPSFIVARYATVTSASLYAGYGMGPVGLVVGGVANPRSGYRELVGGLVSRAVWRDQALAMGFAYADASDGAYLQAFWIPSLNLGPVSIDGNVVWYKPLEPTAVRQFYLNPIGVVVNLTGRVGLGAVWNLGLAEGSASHEGAGPVLRVKVPNGFIRVELLRNLTRSHPEVRFGLQAVF